MHRYRQAADRLHIREFAAVFIRIGTRAKMAQFLEEIFTPRELADLV